MIKCIDHLGLAHKKYPVKLAAKLHPDKWGIGAFDGFFGDVIPALEEFILECRRLNKSVPLVRIHPDWTDHKLIKISYLRKVLLKYYSFARKYAGVSVYVSTTCEHDSRNDKQLQKRYDLIADYKPTLFPVVCPSGKGYTLREGLYANERHGDTVSLMVGNFVSMDGTDITDINVKQWLNRYKNMAAVFGWRSEFNGREKGKPAKPVKLRTNWPTKKDIQYVIKKMKSA